MDVLRKIVQLIKPYWPGIAGGILLGLLVSGITGAIAWSVKPALDDVLAGKKMSTSSGFPSASSCFFQ